MKNEMVINDVEKILSRVKKIAGYKIARTSFAGMSNEDVIQEILINVYKALDKYDPSKSQLDTYLNHVINNKINDCIRIAKKHIAMSNAVRLVDDIVGEEIEDDITTVSVEESGYISVEYLYDIANSLNLSEREVAILKLRLMGYKNEEIGKKLGYTKAFIGRILKGIKDKFATLGSI